MNSEFRKLEEQINLQKKQSRGKKNTKQKLMKEKTNIQ